MICGTGSTQGKRMHAHTRTHARARPPTVQPTKHGEPRGTPPPLAPPTPPPPPRKGDENDGDDRRRPGVSSGRPRRPVYPGLRVAPGPQTLTRVWGVPSPSGGLGKKPLRTFAGVRWRPGSKLACGVGPPTPKQTETRGKRQKHRNAEQREADARVDNPSKPPRPRKNGDPPDD